MKVLARLILLLPLFFISVPTLAQTPPEVPEKPPAIDQIMVISGEKGSIPNNSNRIG